MLLDLEYTQNNTLEIAQDNTFFLVDLEVIQQALSSISSQNTLIIELDITVLDNPTTITPQSNSNIIIELDITVLDNPTTITPQSNSNIINKTINAYSAFDLANKINTDLLLTTGMIIEDILHKKMLNIKDNQWEIIPIVNAISANIDIQSYFNQYSIDKAYTIDKNDKYIDLFNTTVYNSFKTASSIVYSNIKDNYKPYNHSDISTVCWVKRKLTNIICLIVGINYTGQGGAELNQSVSDADKFETFIKSRYANSRLEIIKLTDSKIPTQVGFDATVYPTTANIMTNLGKLLSSSKDIIIYYTGHMNKITDVNGDDLDGTDEIMNTIDGAITDDWFYTHFITKIPKLIKCRIFIDGCYSGGFADFKYKYTSSQFIVNNEINDVNLSKTVCISSSDESKVSYENTNGGVFTTKLLSELQNNGNFNILRFRGMLNDSVRILSTFEVDQEPVLLL